MTDILEQAQQLGKAIASSPQAEELRAAREVISQDEQAMSLLQQFQEQSNKIAQLQQEGKPIEVEDKQQLDQLHGQLVGNEAYKRFNGAQVEYVDIIRKVNEAITGELEETEG